MVNFLSTLALLALPLTGVLADHVFNSPPQARHHQDVARRASGDVQLHKRFDNARLSFYDTEESGNPGACGQHIKNSQFAVAVNMAQYRLSDCFKTITISYKGKTAQAAIMDACPGCPYGGLDLSVGLFHYFEPRGIQVGIIYGFWEFGGGGGAPEPQPEPKPKPKPSPKPSSTWVPPPPPPTSSTRRSSSRHSSTRSSTPASTPSSSSASSTTSSSSGSSTPTPTANPVQNLAAFNQIVLQYANVAVAGAAVNDGPLI